MFRNYFIRNINLGDFLEAFLIASISSILFIRFFLFLTGYPKLGGESLHIAHMLWGGLFMLIAIVLMLSFLSAKMQMVSAVIGGIGFGAFIDELGKFITNDNNYFFQPALALIYIIFLLLFFAFRYLESNRRPSKIEYLTNALELLKEAVIDDMDQEELKKVKQLLRRSDQSNPITIQLEKVLDEITIAEYSPSLLATFRRHLHNFYVHLISSRFFTLFFIIFFALNSLVSLLFLSTTIYASVYHIEIFFIERFDSNMPIAFGEIVFSNISLLFVLAGSIVLKFNRYKALYLFKYSVLVTILFTQFFEFYKEQSLALLGLTFNIIILIGLQYMLDEEKRVQMKSKSS